jgi:hypothetical protein
MLTQDGFLRYLELKVIAYSDKPTIMVVMLFLRPIKGFVQCLGIRLTIYIDKGGMDASVDICSKQMDFVPSTSLLHLGFNTNLVTVQYVRSGPEGCVAMESLLPAATTSQPASVRDAISIVES